MNIAGQPFTDLPRSNDEKGCLSIVVMVFAGLWVSGVIAFCQFATWGWEQAAFTSTAFKMDPRWLVGLVGGLALWLPLFFLARFASPTQRPLFVSWRMMAELVLWMVPARFFSITSSQAVAGWQILAIVVFLMVVRLTAGRKNPNLRFGRLPDQPGIIALAAGTGGLMLLPWVAWGALGSVLDTFLGVLVALLAGTAAAISLEAGIFSAEMRRRPAVGIPWRGLLGAPITLAILAFGLGLNMNEWLLLLVLPPLGWLALALAGRGEDSRSIWPAVAVAIALGISAALVWFDPDELALVVTSGSGELIEWALTAGLVAFGLAVLGAALAGWTRSWWARGGLSGKAAPGFAIAVWVVVGAVYLMVGRPGFYGEQLFVILKDQPDLSSAASIPDYMQRRVAVYTTLTEQAVRSQAELRRTLDSLGFRYQPYYLVNALEVDGGPLLRLYLQSRPEVDRILESPHLRPLPAALPVQHGDQQAPASPDWNLTMIRANQVWDELGITGQGIVIGQSDSGVDGSHPELASQYRGREGKDELSWFDPWFHSRQPVDIGGHGTHTLATSLGKTVGVAPGAQWIGCVNLARNLGNPALYLDCMQFMLAPFPQSGDPFKDGHPELGANVLNNSWGCPVVEGCDPGTFLPAVRALQTAGVFVVASAGNDGDSGCGSVTDPISIYQEVVTVGALDQQGQRASFSSLGPVKVDGSNRIKPDLAAPGEEVLSAFPQGTYARLSGTSMAGPHVVGIVALIWSANPKLIGNIEQTRQILFTTTQPYHGGLSKCGSAGSPDDAVGYGIVNAYAAVQMALQAR